MVSERKRPYGNNRTTLAKTLRNAISYVAMINIGRKHDVRSVQVYRLQVFLGKKRISFGHEQHYGFALQPKS